MDSDLQSQKMNGGWHFGIEDMRSDEEEKENNGMWPFMIARTKWNENRLYFITSYTFLGGINELNTPIKIRSWIK